MAWTGQFKLGRPARESVLEVNPAAVDWGDTKIADSARALEGSLVVSTASRSRPTIRFNGNYITPDQWNQYRSLMMVDDTFLVFEPFDATGINLWESWTEPVTPTDVSTIVIPDNSSLRGSALRVAAGGSTGMTLIGLWDDIPTTAGRLGTGFNLLNGPGAATYSTGFESPGFSVGNLASQGSWAADVGTASDIQVTNTGGEVLTGSQSVRGKASGGITSVKRAVVTQGDPYEVTFQMKWQGTTNSTHAAFRAFTSVAQVWAVKIARVSGVDRLVISNDASDLYNQPITQASTYSFKVQVRNAVMYVYYNGTLVFSGSLASGLYNTIKLEINSTTGTTDVLWDQINLDPLSVMSSTYADATRTITTFLPLPNLNTRFLTYRCPLLACNLMAIPARTEGGWADTRRYDLELVGA